MAVDAAHRLPETAAVSWRTPVDAGALRGRGRLWTLSTVAHAIPFVTTAAVLVVIQPWLAPIAVLALVQAWAIPELYANRGAKVLRPVRRRDGGAESAALGLLGDLVGHEARDLHARTGLVMERGALGVWLVGEAGALLVHRRRAYCWCVHADDPSLPSADRTAHLLLALREDETGFATVANLAFTGAMWRVRRRLPARMRPALDAARAVSKRES